MRRTRSFAFVILGGLAVACGDSDEPIERGGECTQSGAPCVEGFVCAPVSNTSRCFEPVVVRGSVVDSASADAIDGAHVIARDEEGAAISDVAVTDVDGGYSTEIPAPRDEEGKPLSQNVTLASAAQGYLAFPSGLRVALPIDASDAVLEDGTYVLDSALTDIALIELADSADLQSISGSVAPATDDQDIAGVLVVAKGEGTVASAVSDKSGSFTIFNVPAGDFEVSAYADGVQIESESVTVGDEAAAGVTLAATEAATTTVAGTIQIVNAGGGAATSVILVVEDTFDEMFGRGQVPRGLRAPRGEGTTITGAFEIPGVPDGRYVVLAAFENDQLVRDPDQNIAGTDFVHIEVSGGGTFTINESFKVTDALDVMGPGVDEPEAVTSKPTLVWEDDSSEDYYTVRVFDALGEEVWSDLNVPAVSGGGTVSVAYGGPLEVGMYYQFRVLSWRQPGGQNASPISSTEDLRGVFYRPAQ